MHFHYFFRNKKDGDSWCSSGTSCNFCYSPHPFKILASFFFGGGWGTLADIFCVNQSNSFDFSRYTPIHSHSLTKNRAGLVCPISFLYVWWLRLSTLNSTVDWIIYLKARMFCFFKVNCLLYCQLCSCLISVQINKHSLGKFDRYVIGLQPNQE